MGLQVNDGFINIFDYAINFNLNTKIATATDASTYANTTGVTIAVTITNPNGIVLTINITPNGSGTASIPTLNGGVVYGFYTITATAIDSVSSYTLAKISQNICKPTQCPPAKNSDGCVVSAMTFLCANNKLIYQDKSSYVYESVIATTVVKSVTLIDPNNVKQVDAQNVSSFSLSPIVNGKYSLTVNNYAVYDFGDGVTVTIVYPAANQPYIAMCDVNLCELRCAIEDVYAQWKAEKGSGSTTERTLKDQWMQLSFLAWDVESGIACGDDVSAQLIEIEEISGIKCACGCGSTNPNPIICSCTEIVFEEGTGIEIEQITAGDTTTATITNTQPETYKVKTDNADTPADYLFNKVTSDASITITDVDTGSGNKKAKFISSAIWNKGVLNFTVSFETGEVGTISIYPGFKMTVTGIWATVSKTIAGTDNGTITPKNNAGTTMTGGVTTIVASSAVGTNVGLNAITANNSIGAADVIQITTSKTTAGGRCLISIQYSKAV